jgi:hypothetical protein
LDSPQPGGTGTKKKLTAEDAEDAEDAEEKPLIQCFETSAFSAVNFFLVPAPPGWVLPAERAAPQALDKRDK